MKQEKWSFSPQWEEFFERSVEKTWCWELQTRVAMFFREVDLSPEDLVDMDLLDAGCGNGQLTNELGKVARSVVGLDLSSSVDAAEGQRTEPNVRFVHGDLNDPPLPAGSFDLAYSSGVVHHNRSSAETFAAIARLVKPGGRFYCFVYRPGTDWIPWLTIALNEPIRRIVCRLPRPLQRVIVRLHAAAYHALLSVVRPGKYSYDEHVIAAYDAITPRYAHRHWPHEMARWFHEAGFDSPKLTHWDNGGGFGMVAVKRRCGPPAGVNFRI